MDLVLFNLNGYALAFEEKLRNMEGGIDHRKTDTCMYAYISYILNKSQK